VSGREERLADAPEGGLAVIVSLPAAPVAPALISA